MAKLEQMFSALTLETSNEPPTTSRREIVKSPSAVRAALQNLPTELHFDIFDLLPAEDLCNLQQALPALGDVATVYATKLVERTIRPCKPADYLSAKDLCSFQQMSKPMEALIAAHATQLVRQAIRRRQAAIHEEFEGCDFGGLDFLAALTLFDDYVQTSTLKGRFHETKHDTGVLRTFAHLYISGNPVEQHRALNANNPRTLAAAADFLLRIQSSKLHDSPFKGMFVMYMMDTGVATIHELRQMVRTVMIKKPFHRYCTDGAWSQSQHRSNAKRTEMLLALERLIPIVPFRDLVRQWTGENPKQEMQVLQRIALTEETYMWPDEAEFLAKRVPMKRSDGRQLRLRAKM